MSRQAKRKVKSTFVPESYVRRMVCDRLLCINNSPFLYCSSIILPNAILFDDVTQRFDRRARVPADRYAPVVAAGGGTSLSDTNLLRLYDSKQRDTTRDENPREALLKYAKDAEENPMWVNHVYKKTQPKPEFDYTHDELEEQRVVKRKK